MPLVSYTDTGALTPPLLQPVPPPRLSGCGATRKDGQPGLGAVQPCWRLITAGDSRVTLSKGRCGSGCPLSMSWTWPYWPAPRGKQHSAAPPNLDTPTAALLRSFDRPLACAHAPRYRWPGLAGARPGPLFWLSPLYMRFSAMCIPAPPLCLRLVAGRLRPLPRPHKRVLLHHHILGTLTISDITQPLSS